MKHESPAWTALAVALLVCGQCVLAAEDTLATRSGIQPRHHIQDDRKESPFGHFMNSAASALARRFSKGTTPDLAKDSQSSQAPHLEVVQSLIATYTAERLARHVVRDADPSDADPAGIQFAARQGLFEYATKLGMQVKFKPHGCLNYMNVVCHCCESSTPTQGFSGLKVQVKVYKHSYHKIRTQ